MDLQIGQMYEYTATLDEYGGVILPIKAKWGCTDRSGHVRTNIKYQGIVDVESSLEVLRGVVQELEITAPPESEKKKFRKFIRDYDAKREETIKSVDAETLAELDRRTSWHTMEALMERIRQLTEK